MKKPARLTLRQVEKTLRGKKLAAWKAATPAERAEVTAMLNEDAARRHAEQLRDAALKKQSDFVDRFMDQFWAPVRAEQAKAKRKR